MSVHCVLSATRDATLRLSRLTNALLLLGHTNSLFLNVVTPPLADPNATTNWPVIVYFHAGEFYMGAGNDLENNWP